MPRTAAMAALCASVLASASLGAADERRPAPPSKAACGEAYVEAQHLRAEGRLVESRKKLLLCSQDSCPKAVRPDCAQWLPEVTTQVASFAVHARDAQGVELADVQVRVDGAATTDRLLGQPLELDPGPHTVRFEREGSPPIEQQIVAVLGEKLRPLDVRFEAPPPPTPPPSTPAAAPPLAPPAPPARPVPPAAWVLGAVGVASGAGAAVLWALAESRYSSLKATCAPACNPSESQTPRDEVISGDIAVGVGGAALAGAVLLFLARPSVEDRGVARAMPKVELEGSPRGASLGARWWF